MNGEQQSLDHKELCRRARRKGLSKQDAEDVAQDTLIAVWLKGKNWHQGRVGLELKGRCKDARKSNMARRAREVRYHVEKHGDLCEVLDGEPDRSEH